MSTYVIGDIQGCYDALRRLLDRVNFNDTTDELWLVGDLVNRGHKNTGVMEFITGLDRVTAVLGNHDLHFLAIALGQQSQKRSDTLDDILASPGLDRYIDWLRHLPLIHHDAARNLVMVHAGLPPQLSVPTCMTLAREVESVLCSGLGSGQCSAFLKAMYGNEPAIFDDRQSGMTRLRVIANCFTRMRYCTAVGQLELEHKADICPDGFAPWFSFPRQDNITIIFGHWAALNGKADAHFVRALDTGCVWGRELTALRLEDDTRFAVPAIQ